MYKMAKICDDVTFGRRMAGEKMCQLVLNPLE